MKIEYEYSLGCWYWVIRGDHGDLASGESTTRALAKEEALKALRKILDRKVKEFRPDGNV